MTRMPNDSPFEHAFAVIMAGGSGTRFWPLSRRKQPKQLLELFGRKTLLERTVEHVWGLIPPERIYVFTSELVRPEVVRRLSMIPRAQIIAEPASRNTAPTVGLAAHEVLARDRDAVMIVLPSDHVILKPGVYRQAVRAACRFASVQGRSVVMGLHPTRPETGYGYLRVGTAVARFGRLKVCRVEKFTEKPPLPVARRYVASGRYVWNSGMFVWRASTLIANLERYQPEMARVLARIAAAGGARNRKVLRRLFPRLERISVDYALMERILEVYAVRVAMGWNDVGSWAVAYELSRKDREGNVRPAHSLGVAAHGNMIVSPKKFVVAVGVRNLVVVDTDDALLVSARERSQEVGKAVQELEKQGRRDLL